MSVTIVKILFAFLFYELFVGWSSACPGDPCRCEIGLLECICNQKGIRENITLRTGLSSSMGTKMMTTVTIHHCGVVTVENAAFKFQNIDSLEFHDLDELHIAEYSFFSVKSIEHVNISNVRKFAPKIHSFFPISNISAIYISDTKMGRLDTGFFGVSNVNIFMMANVEIDGIDEKAIQLDHVNVFTISNSEINHFYTNGIRINGTCASMFLSNLTVGTAEPRSFFFNEITSYMIISDCHFDLIQYSFVKTNNISKLSFTNNTIQRCETDAFDFVVPVRESLKLEGNQFQNAKSECLPANFTKATELIIRDNHFVCNCDLEWFLREPYLRYYRDSTCTVDANKTHVTQVKASEFKLKYQQGECINGLVDTNTGTDRPTQSTVDDLPVKGPKKVSKGKGSRNFAWKATPAHLYPILLPLFSVKWLFA